jgi:hypothetical protein
MVMGQSELKLQACGTAKTASIKTASIALRAFCPTVFGASRLMGPDPAGGICHVCHSACHGKACHGKAALMFTFHVNWVCWRCSITAPGLGARHGACQAKRTAPVTPRERQRAGGGLGVTANPMAAVHRELIIRVACDF